MSMRDELNRVTEALRAAGHPEATRNRSGFFAVVSGTGVIVALDLEEHAEGHFDSPAHHQMQARAADEYRQALEAAGWAVKVSADCQGLTVTRPREGGLTSPAATSTV